MTNTDATRHYDLLIIGTGSGNSILGPEFDDWDVAIADGGAWFGGTCLNVGCIPTKMLVRTAEVAGTPREAGRFGLDEELRGVDWPAIRDRVFGRIDPIAAAGEEYRAHGCPNVTLYREDVRFLDAHTVVTRTGRRISADRVVVAAGSRPVVPDVPGADLPGVHTSDTVMRLDRLPERLAVVGGGYVAAEFAHVFSALGVRVTQLVRRDRALPQLDEPIASRWARAVAGRWELVTDAPVEAVKPVAGGLRVLTGGDRPGEWDAEAVLFSTGRRPNADRLDAARAGFDLHPDGRLAVDAEQRMLAGGVPVPGVWALGDVSSPYRLKHVANAEARTVAHNLRHPDELRRTDHRFVPSAVFTHPEIALVGLTPAAARARGLDVAVKHQDYAATAYGWALEDDGTGCATVVADRATGLLVGAQILGPQASTLIQPLVQAMAAGQHVADIARGQYWIHPALTEVVENALLGVLDEM